MTDREQLHEILFREKEDKHDGLKNIGIGAAGLTGAGALGYLGYKGGKLVGNVSESVRTSTQAGRDAVKNQVEPVLKEIIEKRVNPAIESMRQAGQNIQDSTAHTRDIGKFYTKHVRPDLTRRYRNALAAQAAFKEGLTADVSNSPIVKAGRSAGKMVRRIRQGIRGGIGSLKRVAMNIGSLNLSAREELGIILFQSELPAPPIDSWNPIKRYRQHKELEKWVASRPPSAGISLEDVESEYPEDKPFRKKVTTGTIAGMLGGGALGAAAGIYGLKRRHIDGDLAARITVLGGILGGGAGAAIAGGKRYAEHAAEAEARTLRTMAALKDPNGQIDPKTVKLPAPHATSYGEVAGELKKQNVGFLSRHAAALGTRPAVWGGSNAMFIPKGDKGLVVTTKRVHPLILRHEAGHAKDYAHYGGERGFQKAYKEYGNSAIDRRQRIANTMLPEHRAWAYAKPKNKKERELMRDALGTYKHGMDLNYSAREELKEILFEDPRPRNSLGMFSGGDATGGPNPAAMRVTYDPRTIQPMMSAQERILQQLKGAKKALRR